MGQKFFRAASHPLRLLLVGAALAVAWSAVCVVAGSAASSEAASNSPSTLASLGSAAPLTNITDPIAPIVAPVAAAAAPVTAALAPVLAPVVRVAAPVVAPVTAPLAAVIAPVATIIAPLDAPIAAVIAPVGVVVAPVTPIAPDVVTFVPEQVAVDPFVGLAPAGAPHSTLASVPGALVSPSSDLKSSEASTYVGAVSASFAAPSTSTEETVLSQSPPAGGPFGVPVRGSAERAILPAPAGSSSGQGGSAGGLNEAFEATLTTPSSVRLVSSSSAFGTEVLPSAPTFDPGSSPD